MATPTYIVTFRLGCEVVTSRHKTLRAARKSLKANRIGRYRIYRAVGLEKRARGVAQQSAATC